MRSLALNRLWGSESADAGTAPDTVANSDVRVVQLEAALAEERRRSVQKDEELQKMQKLMAKLESHIEQQAKDSDQEQKRLSSLETVLQKREAGSEDSDKVKRLVIALAETKRLKETAEKTAIDEGERASRLERQISDMKKTDFFAADTQPVANSNNAEEELQRLREECAAEQQKREDRGPAGNICNIYVSNPFCMVGSKPSGLSAAETQTFAGCRSARADAEGQDGAT
ncbi:unnamed protein product [Symbiodinium necroappetens]|uniref:Uncharacterized protein n=1 Tax=Symbiodinium necroappetens TaxID=1628268 RepID=A0A812JHA6_9DINO|nr:unnamed protein product [Symbiodinium necroappetens]